MIFGDADESVFMGYTRKVANKGSSGHSFEVNLAKINYRVLLF